MVKTKLCSLDTIAIHIEYLLLTSRALIYALLITVVSNSNFYIGETGCCSSMEEHPSVVLEVAGSIFDWVKLKI